MDKYFKHYNLDLIIPKRNNEINNNRNNRKVFIKFTTILYLVLHVSIIIVFEILFYFLYIIKKEYEVFDYLIYDITHNEYNNLNETTKIIINSLLKNRTDINYIKSRANSDRNERNYIKNELFIKSSIIMTFFILLSISIISFGLYKKRIKFRYLLINLLTILCMISIFEYAFFTNIISHIKPVSYYELLNSIINNLTIIYIDG